VYVVIPVERDNWTYSEYSFRGFEGPVVALGCDILDKVLSSREVYRYIIKV
jgi:hypothetical protein